ncbi:MAG: hypothetical protein A2017_22335 [Lentisphaerae bacterium GWF2_44_16]|nr:MAG: hypothetical protein A2017_22335 [Lentisphaerae bacterium GWF2_44_16]
MLAGILVPALSASRGKAQEIKCSNNLKQTNILLSEYESEHDGTYPAITVAPAWGEPTGWMNLIAKRDSDRFLFKCTNDNRREFSYSLNTRELCYDDDENFTSWKSSRLCKVASSSAFILVEESDTSMFSVADCDQDNYSQNVNSYMEAAPKHKSGVSMLFLDGHTSLEKYFDSGKMTYFTGELNDPDDPAVELRKWK